MTALYQLAIEFRETADKLADLDLPPEVVADTLESIGGDLELKAQNVALFTRNLEATAAAIKQAKSTEGPKIREALESLQTKVEGVVTTYDKPFTKDDHEAITANIPVFGEVKEGRVVFAYSEDMKKASDVRVKDPKAKAAAAPAPAKK